MLGLVRAAVAILLVLLPGCGNDDLADEVDLSVRLRDTTVDGRAVTWDLGTWAVRVVRLRPCPSPPIVLDWPGPIPEAVRTLPDVPKPQPWSVGFDAPIPVVPPAAASIRIGPWCELDLVTRGTLSVVGHVEDGGELVIDVELPSLGAVATTAFARPEVVTRTVDGAEESRITVRALIAELGDASWLAALAEVPGPGELVQVEPGDAGYDAIRTALIAGAALYADLDGDGVLDPDERATAEIGPLERVGGPVTE
jgi:hypothetical protein